MILPSKALMLACTAVVGTLAVVTGREVLAEGITVDAPYVLAIMAGAGSVVGILFKLLIASRDREFALILAERDRSIAELEGIKKSYSDMAAEAVKASRDITNYYREKLGESPLVPTAPVISESHSPSTAKQREAAFVQTLRADLAQVKLASNQPPRVEPECAETPIPKDA
jgi:hypothetical protein